MNREIQPSWACDGTQPGISTAMLHAQRMAQAEHSPRIGQQPRNSGIADMDPDDMLAAARRAAAKVREAVSGTADGTEPALELAEQFAKLDEWLPDFRPLPEDWA